MVGPAWSLFGRRSKDAAAASTVAAPPVVPESPRSLPSFEAEPAQYAEDVAMLTAEKAKQQASICKSFCGPLGGCDAARHVRPSTAPFEASLKSPQ